MITIPNSRLQEEQKLLIDGDQFDITYISPKACTNKLVLFVPGLNGSGSVIKYWDEKKFENFHFASFDPRGQCRNKATPSTGFHRYLKDINQIIKYLKGKYNVKEIFLLGESWGAGLTTLYNHFYSGIKGFVIWNMPFKPTNVANDKWLKRIVSSIKRFLTNTFNVETYGDAKWLQKLTRNKILQRSYKINAENKLSNKLIVASWKTLSRSWKILDNEHNNLNFIYIQSAEDLLSNMEEIKKIASKTSKFILYDKGDHILSFDNEMREHLFEDISKFLNRNS